MNILTLHRGDTDVHKLKFPKETVTDAAYETQYVPDSWDAIVRWGNTEGSDHGHMVVLNPAEALRRVENPEYVVETLAAHGISTRYYRPAHTRVPKVRARYRIHVCDLRTVAVYRASKKGYRRVRALGTKQMQRAREMAVRTAYVLGLHFACVEIGKLNKKKFVPMAVNPNPALTKVTGRLYAKAIALAVLRRQKRLLGPRKPLVLGADLEFIMRRRKGGIIYASRYFPRRGSIGYDQQGSRRYRGAHPIVEVRPAPTPDPLELVERIRLLLKRAAARTPRRGVRWEAGSLPVRSFPIGGHIHFSGVELTTELLRALDNYVAFPLMLLENPVRARRRRAKYGWLGEFRWESYGGFEYRTPSSWIVGPQFAAAVLCLTKLVVDNYEVLNRDLFSSPEICRLFYRSEKEGSREIFESIWREIEALADYPRYAAYLEIIPELVRSNRRWHETRDIRVRWGLVGPSKKRRRRSVQVTISV